MLSFLYVISLNHLRSEPEITIVYSRDEIQDFEQNTTLATLTQSIIDNKNAALVFTPGPIRKDAAGQTFTTINDTLKNKHAYAFIPDTYTVLNAFTTKYQGDERNDHILYPDVSAFNSNISSYINSFEVVYFVENSDTLPKVDSTNLPNPFTPNIWNGIFQSIFCILLMIWALVYFHKIDVQKTFAKID